MALDYNELRKIRKALQDKLELPDDHPDSMVTYFKENERNKKHIDRWVLRLQDYFDKKTNKIELIEKLLVFNEKVSDRLFHKGIDGESVLMGLTYKALYVFGKPFETEDYNMFTTEGFYYLGYKFEIIRGQGTFTIIRKI